jgi:hypothetical protein
MKLALKTGILTAALFLLGGCVYEPGYGYVRSDGYRGDVYYGTAYDSRPVYYDYEYDYWPGYYYGPALGLGFYYDNYHHHRYYGGHSRYSHFNRGPGPGYRQGHHR